MTQLPKYRSQLTYFHLGISSYLTLALYNFRFAYYIYCATLRQSLSSVRYKFHPRHVTTFFVSDKTQIRLQQQWLNQSIISGDIFIFTQKKKEHD